MSLPPGFLDELRTRVSLSSVVGRKVVWDARKSNQGKGDMWAPCPFHQEKSPSFHVDDRKGFYYCFGCHAKGDAVTFVKETENVGFMEAVEILAREAGMPMPARDPMAAQKADRRGQLIAVMEEAVKYFRLMLRSSAGAAARDYLASRRITEGAQDRFGIGYAPDARTGLIAALGAKGIVPDLLVDAGLAVRPEGGGAPYDRFRGRIIFPIRDAQGRAISLGGRAMDPGVSAKYLNGPETELFDKGRTLFNFGPAREAAGKGAPLVVAEGYVDVIALVEAGFGAAVAPLGTAVTEEQLRLMWRIHPEPVIALDGDAAGIRAAIRVIDLALPLIEAGQGLRFAPLPAGMDPDDLIRAQGAGAFQRVLDGAQPMVALLWQRETDGKVFDSPERRAGLDKSLRAALAKIRDPGLRDHYAAEIRRLRAVLFAGTDLPRTPFRKGRAPPVATTARAGTKASLLGSTADPEMEDRLREAVILATFALHPSLVARFETALERMDLATPDHQRLRRALLACASAPDGAAHWMAARAAVADVLERITALPHVLISPPLRSPDDAAIAAHCISEELAKLEARRAARRELEDAMTDITALADEGLTWRLARATEARNQADHARVDDSRDLGEDRAALSRALQGMLDNEGWVKKRH